MLKRISVMPPNMSPELTRKILNAEGRGRRANKSQDSSSVKTPSFQ